MHIAYPVRTDEETLYWLALSLTPGLGARKSADLLGRYGSPMAIFRSSASELQSAGLPGSVARSITSGCAFEDAAEQQERLKSSGTGLVTVVDDAYPPALREIYDPPPLLFLRGRMELLNTVMVALVGSR